MQGPACCLDSRVHLIAVRFGDLRDNSAVRRIYVGELAFARYEFSVNVILD